MPGVDDVGIDHFGSPFVEQRTLASGGAAVELANQSVVKVTGSDRLTWLNSMTSQALSHLAPGESAETLLLDPQGRIEVVIRLVDDGETCWLIVESSMADALITHLNRMRFALRVEVAEVSDTQSVIGYFRGGSAESVIETLRAEATFPVWHDPWQTVVAGGWQYAPVDNHPAALWQCSIALLDHASLQRLKSVISSGSTGVAGLLAFEALRIEAWRPSQADVDSRSLPHEFDWLRSAVHLSKGCYRGQETVAKVHNLGHPPRRLALIHLDGSDVVLPAPGDFVYLDDDDSPIGRVTSVARHYEWGSIALVLLKRSVAEDAPLRVVHDEVNIPATQEVIVPRDAGSTRDIPRLRRV